jgi:formylglycine-generating enzyme required for sulfatase activity
MKKYINSIGMEFVYIPPGCFVMGSNDANPSSNVKPAHAVNITKGFWMQTTEVTQVQWNRIMGSNPSYFKGENRPVETVSWDDVQLFITKLNAKEKGKYRLPTEAEWEYSCRGGKAGETWCGGNDVDAVGWLDSNSGSQTHPVAGKRPNGFGLYDMCGNVWEWASDWYDECYYGNSPKDDPQGVIPGSGRVFRGGGWGDVATYFRASNRGGSTPGNRGSGLGFRLASPVQ